MSDHDLKEDTFVDELVEEDSDLREPPMYKVVLLNDNYTSMEFVTMILETIFHKTSSEAKVVMLSVHEKGAGVAGVYTKEIAETKIAIVHSLASQKEFPLRCTIEPES